MNSKIVLMGAGLIVVAGAVYAGATGAFFTSAATSTGNTFAAGTLTLQIAPDVSGSHGTFTTGTVASPATLASAWNFANLAPGGTPQIEKIWLNNSGTIDGMHLGVSSNSTVTTGPDLSPQLRITTLTLGGSNLLTGGAGASIAAYAAPTNCTVTLANNDRLQTAINAAAPGAVICATGTNYSAAWETENTITVTHPNITIESMAGPSVTASIPFNVTASGVTIRGFSISDPNGRYGVGIYSGAQNVTVKDNVLTNIGTGLSEGAVQAVDLEPGSTGTFSGYNFTGNTITNIGSASLVSGADGTSAKGIYIGDSTGTGTISGLTIQNNVISNVQASTLAFPTGRGGYGILVGYGKNVTHTGSVVAAVIKNNSISNLSGAWETAIGLEGNTSGSTNITLNDIHDIGSASVGVNIEDNSGVSNVSINQNNLTPNVVLGIRNTMGVAVNGQNNWWGDLDPSNQVSANVSTAGFLGGAVAGLINGTDSNNNGYADIQDLHNTPIVNSTVGLNHQVPTQLVMGVQLDGPTTDNTFQGAALNTDVTFTLSQQ